MAQEIDPVTQYRPLLFAIAYRMLGSVMDAEDIVQEAFLRWRRAPAEGVASPRAWLSATVTHLCLDHLRSARVRREEYVGPWLPEPLLTDRASDPAEGAALAESVSMAFLVLLETLTPVERAVFLLHDVFGYGYAEIARIVGKGEAACRQLAHRAREHIAERRPRFEPQPERREALTRQFVAACAGGDLGALVATLADDVTVWSDGGGKVNAARKPVHGADKVARFFLNLVRQAPPGFTIRHAEINGQPGLIGEIEGRPLNALALDIADGRVRAIRIVVNPDKLRALVAAPSAGGAAT